MLLKPSTGIDVADDALLHLALNGGVDLFFVAAGLWQPVPRADPVACHLQSPEPSPRFASRPWLRAEVSALLCVAALGRLGAGAVLVPDVGYRLRLGEPGAGGVRLIEPGRAEPLADLGHPLGLHPPRVRPGRQADPPAYAFGSACRRGRCCGG